MPTKIDVAPEKLYECEVKRRRVRASGSGYEPFWKVKTVAEALVDGDSEFRCKDCHGPLKLHKRNTSQGPTSHVEHKYKIDSEYCAGGLHFRSATHGLPARFSATPVQ